MKGSQLLPRPCKLIELSCLSLSGKLIAWATNLISMRSENHLGKGLYLKKWGPRYDQPELGAMPWHKGVREKQFSSPQNICHSNLFPGLAPMNNHACG